MKHKHFFGTSVQDAMQRACHKMGEEIVLLDSKPLSIAGNNTGKMELVQITVGVPDSKTSKQNKNNVNVPNDIPGPVKSDFSKYLAQYSDGLYYPDINRKQPNLLRDKMKKTQTPTNLDINEIPNLLMSAGVSLEHITTIMSRLKVALDTADGTPNVMENLKNLIIGLFEADSPQEFLKVNSQRIIAIVGSTGVGKTSVIMKMAAGRTFFKGKKVVILSTDNYRIAGSESLRLFSNLVGIPFIELKNPGELDSQIEGLKNYDVILIDTPGRSPLFPNFYNELQDCFSINRNIEKLVVLSAAADLEDVYLSSALFTLLNPSGIIVTKLDETSRAGKLVSIQLGIGIPVLFLSEGQSIPQDLTVVNGKYIWDKIVQTF